MTTLKPFADTLAQRLAGYRDQPFIEFERTWYTGDHVADLRSRIDDALTAAGVAADEPVGIVVRNRLSILGSRNKQLVAGGLKELSLRMGFRAIDGFAERVVYREFFPRGLTALDDLDEATLGARPSMGHVTAREEVTSLLRQLKLPLDERGRRRAANRAEWFNQVDKPLELHDIIGA